MLLWKVARQRPECSKGQLSTTKPRSGTSKPVSTLIIPQPTRSYSPPTCHSERMLESTIGSEDSGVALSSANLGESEGFVDPGGTGNFALSQDDGDSDSSDELKIEHLAKSIVIDADNPAQHHSAETQTVDSDINGQSRLCPSCREVRECAASAVNESGSPFKNAIVARLKSELENDESYLETLNKVRGKTELRQKITCSSQTDITGEDGLIHANLHAEKLKCLPSEKFIDSKSPSRDMKKEHSKVSKSDDFVQLSETDEGDNELSDATQLDRQTPSFSEDPITLSLSPTPLQTTPEPANSAPSSTKSRRKKKPKKEKWRMLSPVGNEYIFVTKQVPA